MTTREFVINILGHDVTQVQVIITTKRRYSTTLKKPFILPSPMTNTTNTIRFFEPSDIRTMFKLANTVPYQNEMACITTDLVKQTYLYRLRILVK
jgi:hypothetical protein